jgi:hypothetical protein
LSFSKSPSSEYKNKKIYFEYTYYAIKSLELLVDALGSFENITNLGFDVDALTYYITRNIVEDASRLYFDPRHSDNTEIILENTYYAIYTLKAIKKYDLDDEKIRNFVVQNLNSQDFMNIYYSFKISKLLGLEIVFEVSTIQNLVQSLYSEELGEFYLTSQKSVIDQDVFSWICEMSVDTTLRLSSIYEGGYFESTTIMLGGYNTVGLKFCNLILSSPLETDYEVQFNSTQVGSYTLENQTDNTFEKKIIVPVEPNNYPIVTGTISVYNGSDLEMEFPVSFETTYELNPYAYNEVRSSNGIFISVNCSIKTGQGNLPLRDGNVYADVYNGTDNIKTINFNLRHFEDHTQFTLDFSFENARYKDETCELKVYLTDGYKSDTIELNSTILSVEINPDSDTTITDPGDGDNDGEDNNSTLIESIVDTGGLIPVVATLIGVPGTGIIGSVIITKNKKLKIKKAKKSQYDI